MPVHSVHSVRSFAPAFASSSAVRFRLRSSALAVCLLGSLSLVFLSAHADPPAAQTPAASTSQTPPPAVFKANPEVQTLLDQGRAAYLAGKDKEAADLYEQALIRARALADRKGETEALRGQGRVYSALGQPQKTLELYQQALSVAQALKDATGQAQDLNNIGTVYSNTGQPQKTLEFYEQALPLYRAISDKNGEAGTLTNIGNVYSNIGQPQKALEFYQQALPLHRVNGNKEFEANTLGAIGAVYSDTGQPQKALEFHQQALRIYQSTGNKDGEAGTLNNIGIVYKMTGQTQMALEFYELALPLHRANGNKEFEANTLNGIGAVYSDTGQPRKALEFQQQALAIFRDIGYKQGEANTLNSIGSFYSNTGQPQKALEFFHQALPIQRATSDKNGEAGTLTNIGLVYYDTGQTQKALEFYQQALPLHRATGNRVYEANTLGNIGIVYSNTGQPQKALGFFQQALRIYQSTGNKDGEAGTLTNIGIVYNDTGQPQKAMGFYELALPLHRANGNREFEANTLDALSDVEQRLHQPGLALAHSRQAVALLEELRANLGGYSESKSALLASKLPFYYDCIALLLQSGRTDEAFTLAQKTKGRALLDLLGSGRVVLDGSLTPAEKQEQQDLRFQADYLNQQMVKEAAQNEVGGKKRFTALQQQQREVEAKLQTLTDTLYARHPGLADKQIATTATLDSLYSLLPSDTAILDYIVVSRKKLLLFVVTTRQGKATVKVYPISVTTTQLQQECAAFRAACADPRKDYRPLSARLSRLLLSPASAQLAGKKRLVVCPDGPLWNVPFQALTLRTAGKGDVAFLWQRYDLAYASSATGVQAALRANSQRTSKPTKTLLVMANPDFGSSKRFGDLDDLPGQRPLVAPIRPILSPIRPLLAPTRSVIELPSSTMTVALETRGGRIASLPGTQREADALHLLFPEATVFTGLAAQESTAKEEMGKYRYLHFATHGFLNDAAPLLSSIVLAQPDKNDAKASKEDGFLTAREVFDLQLNADLVTLSACNTGRGNIRTGEGVVGLSWAFFVAGVPTQVVSQWSVDDAATAQLMRAFYSHLKAGEGKSQALRQAALSLQQGKGHHHPYYWAPFLLMGDWRR